MATTGSSAGRCPTCGGEVPESRVLIEYTRRGSPARYAECPSCRTVVNPE